MTWRVPLFSVTLFLLGLMSGCVRKPAVSVETARCTIGNARVNVNDRRLTVIWDKHANCTGYISGYYIYISREPLVARYPGNELPESVTPFNHTAFPGDTDPHDNVEHFEADRLQNGVKYYVSVRVVYPDRSLSKPTNEVLAVCGPRREVELPVRYASDRDGFSFDDNDYVRADALENDVYFFSKEGVDYLCSPSRLGGFLKENRFRLLPFRGELDEVARQLAAQPVAPSADRVEVAVGDWVHVLTASGANALIKILAISGNGDKRSIRFYLAYSPLTGELIF